MSKLSDFSESKEQTALYRQWISTPIAEVVLEILRDAF